ncbi:hypothetical protein CCR75_001345 [Bremia lactucae]|uniref:Uncharacterized protein n=1 Tax=Bremia lactucae TaxID=4779 RepID=A0A976FF47_BRELC|nr:hypothetical protein CCR75_001345 [Bremia lactucae]
MDDRKRVSPVSLLDQDPVVVVIKANSLLYRFPSSSHWTGEKWPQERLFELKEYCASRRPPGVSRIRRAQLNAQYPTTKTILRIPGTGDGE